MTPADLKVEHHFTDLGSLRMHWVEAGQGPMVVLLHGFPESWWSWRRQLAPLAAAGFRVVAPDQRGYGDSDKHGPYDLHTLVDDVCKLIESQGESKVRVVGHDWGGAVAWHLAATRPDRCDRVCVLNCPHLAMLRRGLTKPSQLKRSWYMGFFQLPLVPEWVLTRNDGELVGRMLRASSKSRAALSDDEVRPFRDGVQRPGAASAMLGWYRAAARQLVTGTVEPEPTIEVPAQLIWGMEDPALGFEDLVPGTERYVTQLAVRRIEGAGHFVQSEAPEAVNRELLAFLR